MENDIGDSNWLDDAVSGEWVNKPDFIDDIVNDELQERLRIRAIENPESELYNKDGEFDEVVACDYYTERAASAYYSDKF